VSTEKLPQEFIKEFNSVLKHGIDNVLLAIKEGYNLKSLSKDQTIEYLVKRIDYNLDADKRKALDLFLEYIKKL
jgi:chorismate dehydratase